MAKNVNDFIKKLPKRRQDIIEKRAAKLIATEATLQELRKALHHSQEKVGEELGVSQAAVSKIERRTDMYVSTLRAYIEAVGGRLDIVARFPGGPPVHISQFEELE